MKAPVISHTWLLATHGIDGGPGIAATHARRLAPGRDVRVGCLRGRPELAEATESLDDDAVILPLLMVRGFIYDRMLERIPERLHARITPPLGEHPALLDLVEHRARSLARSRGWNPSTTDLLLIGHGTTRHSASDRTVLDHTAAARQWGFASVTPAFLDAPPQLEEIVADLRTTACVAIGYFIDPGPHGIDDVREALTPLADQVAYEGPLGTDPLITDLIADLMPQGRRK